MITRKQIRAGDWQPVLLWVKHPDAPPKKAILLDLDRCEYIGSIDPAYSITLYSHSGLDILVDACLAARYLQFGLTHRNVGRLFTGRIVGYEVFHGLVPSMTIRVSAPRFEEYDLSAGVAS